MQCTQSSQLQKISESLNTLIPKLLAAVAGSERTVHIYIARESLILDSKILQHQINLGPSIPHEACTHMIYSFVLAYPQLHFRVYINDTLLCETPVYFPPQTKAKAKKSSNTCRDTTLQNQEKQQEAYQKTILERITHRLRSIYPALNDDKFYVSAVQDKVAVVFLVIEDSFRLRTVSPSNIYFSIRDPKAQRSVQVFANPDSIPLGIRLPVQRYLPQKHLIWIQFEQQEDVDAIKEQEYVLNRLLRKNITIKATAPTRDGVESRKRLYQRMHVVAAGSSDRNYNSEHSEDEYLNPNEDSCLRPDPKHSKVNLSNLKALCQFSQAFIVCQNDSQLYLIDQHAASEKIVYEKLQDAPIEPKQTSTTIEPEGSEEERTNTRLKSNSSVRLPVEFAPLLQDSKQLVQSLGWRFFDEQVGNDLEVTFTQVPSKNLYVYTGDDFQHVLQNQQTVYEGEQHSNTRSEKLMVTPNLQKWAAARACKTSYRVGQKLSVYEMQQILDNLGKLRAPYNCPHLRPTVLQSLSLKETFKSIRYHTQYSL